MLSPGAPDARFLLYRLLSDPVRLRVLALTAEAELSVGEVAEILDQTQPNVSRHATALRVAGLLADRRDGTRTLLRATSVTREDPVVADALAEGRRLSAEDGGLVRVAELVRARDARARELFAGGAGDAEPDLGDLSAYLRALGALLPRRGVAVDAGTGDGMVLEAIAPLFERIVAVDRSEARLDRARRRAADLGLDHVELVCGEIDGPEVHRAVGGGADVVVAGRVLHHAPEPAMFVRALAELLAPGGRLLVVDYAPHGDEAFREAQADVWAGFDPADLLGLAADAGLVEARVIEIPPGCWRDAPAVKRPRLTRVRWIALVASRPFAAAPRPRIEKLRSGREAPHHERNEDR